MLLKVASAAEETSDALDIAKDATLAFIAAGVGISKAFIEE
jgi:hypothetical protein